MKFLLKASVVAVMSAASFSSFATDASFDATLTVMPSVQLEKLTDLEFGNVVGGQASTVVIAPTDAGAASFDVSGQPEVAVLVSMPVNTSTLIQYDENFIPGDGRIEVSDFTFGGGVAADGKGVIGLNGKLASPLTIGATATVDSLDGAGQYLGTATVQVVYN